VITVERHEPAVAGPVVVTAADMVAGHVVLDVSCLDRLYLNGYVSKLQAFYRVLRPGGRISVFEPINVLMRDPDRLLGYDITPVKLLAAKLGRSMSPSGRPVSIPCLISTSVTWSGTPSRPGSPTSTSNCASP
jgi:hypothetical protein